MSCQLAFPPKADMMSVAALRDEWLAQIENQTEASIDCTRLEMMTAAAAQLVVSLAKCLEPMGGHVVLCGVPAMLSEDFSLLGLTEFLQEPQRHV